MTKTPVYCDYNAGAPIRAEAAVAMSRALAAGGNPSSVHGVGRRMRAMIEDARERIAGALEASAENIVFTSGATEALHLALTSTGAASLIVSAVEHDAVFEHAGRALKAERVAPVNGDGLIDLDALGALLETAPKPALVAVQLANNETGVIQPIAELVATCRANSVLLHTDAVQAVGKIPVNFRALGVDAMTIAPHKFHGPLGIGALIVRHGVKLGPQLFGGFQQAGLRPGTESVALAVGFHRALERWHAEAHERGQRMRALGAQLESELLAEIPGAVIVGQRAARLPHTLNVAFPGINRQALAMALDLAGVAASTGSACASGSSEPSPVLLAMGLAPEVVEGSIRLSWGAFTTPAEMAEASRRILKCVKHLGTQ
jgi:cysteine desulfurase